MAKGVDINIIKKITAHWQCVSLRGELECKPRPSQALSLLALAVAIMKHPRQLAEPPLPDVGPMVATGLRSLRLGPVPQAGARGGGSTAPAPELMPITSRGRGTIYKTLYVYSVLYIYTHTHTHTHTSLLKTISFQLEHRSITGRAHHSHKLSIAALRPGWDRCQGDKWSRENEV